MRDLKFDLIYKGEHRFHHKKYHLCELMNGINKICDIHQTMELVATRQFTGLKDKKGVEIYEGDIVKAFTVFGMAYDYAFSDDNDPTHIYQIVFDDGCFQFKNTKQWSDGSNDWRSIENVELFKVEIIGNIYENPELLKTPN